MTAKRKIKAVKAPEVTNYTPVEHLVTLRNSAGWKLLVEGLEREKEIVEAKLFGDVPKDPEETDEALKEARRTLNNFIHMPDDMIEDAGVAEPAMRSEIGVLE